MSVTSGSAPFTGCYEAETTPPSSGQQAGGTWALEITDDQAGQVGTLTGWTLVLCGL